MCDGICNTCPFNFWSEEAAYVSNLGCLPTPKEIIGYKESLNRNWQCHSDYSKPCVGFIQAANKRGLDYKTGKPTTLEDWNNGVMIKEEQIIENFILYGEIPDDGFELYL
jgi:hypothetical protein